MISIILTAGYSIQLKSWCTNSNICPKQIRAGVVLFQIAVASAFWFCTQAFALSGNRTITQYVHTAWGTEKGYAGGTVYAIAQSTDGYIWLGTERGLVRFDGSEFTEIELPLSDNSSLRAVHGLVEDTNGNLWIRLDGPRLLRYRDGEFEDAVRSFGIHEAYFTAMSHDKNCNLLLWGPQNGTLDLHNGTVQHLFPRDWIDGIVISLLQTSTGALWLGSRDAGLYRIENGILTKIVSEIQVHSINALVPSEHGGIWIGSENGLHLWEHGVIVDLKLSGGQRKTQVFALVRDRNHNLWAGTDDGLYRIDPKREIVTGAFRSQEGPEISSVYEDNDGNIWFAGSHGLERLRDGMFTSIAPQEPSLNEIGGPLFVDEVGRVWFGPASGGLFCLENGKIKRVAIPGLDNDLIYSIDGRGDDLWLGRQRGGLTRVTRSGTGWSSRTFTPRDGLAQNSVYTVTRGRDGTVWAGTVSGGISVLRNGKFTTYTTKNGLASNAIFSSLEAADGTMWFASPSGLITFAGGRWLTYKRPDTDPPANVRTVFEDSTHSIWIGTSHGIAWFDQGRIRMPSTVPHALTEEVVSIGEDAHGFLWIGTAEHVLQIDRARLLNGSLTESDVVSYGAEDGLGETKGVRRDRSLVSDSSGRIWLSLSRSIAVADMREADTYGRAVRVRIEPISPGSASLVLRQGLDLAQDTRSIGFRFAGTNMAMQKRTRFRYRLDSLDQAWSADVAARQVVYTHLPPGTYTFRIMASNALGDWNGPENDFTFTIRPAFWQTWYFRALSVVLLVALVIACYRIRLMQVTRRLSRRFQDRLVERTRIAQDLHDTLLQGVISASMQLDVVQDELPDNSPAKPVLTRVLQRMREVTREGREALRGLRTADSYGSLEGAFERMLGDIVSSPSSETVVHVQGSPRQMKTAVVEEVYRIAREAYLNSVAHAGAKHIEIAIDYGLRVFRLLVRDDGRGFDAEVLNNGRDGHWGLTGMRERAEAIGSVLTIRTDTPGGTVVELRVPATIAYSAVSARRFKWPWRTQSDCSEPQKETQQST